MSTDFNQVSDIVIEGVWCSTLHSIDTVTGSMPWNNAMAYISDEIAEQVNSQREILAGDLNE